MTLFPSRDRVILSLCDHTGEWSRPYREAGYQVVQVDLADGQDVRTLRYPGKAHGVLAAFPCTEFAGSGARWWEAKDRNDPDYLLRALSIADACCRIALLTRAEWYCFENPVGRLRQWYGPPTMSFHPCDYGDPYTKRTLLWGRFNTALPRTPVAPTDGSRMHKLGPSADRQALRSVTPSGFARAFFAANP